MATMDGSIGTHAEQLIGTVHTRDLPPYPWPIVRLLFPRFVEELQLGHFVQDLLANRTWDSIRLVPRESAGEIRGGKIVEVYGTPTSMPN